METGGFATSEMSKIGQVDGATHIISEWADETVLSFAGSKDNSAAPFLVTLDWLRECFLQNRIVEEKEYFPPIDLTKSVLF